MLPARLSCWEPPTAFGKSDGACDEAVAGVPSERITQEPLAVNPGLAVSGNAIHMVRTLRARAMTDGPTAAASADSRRRRAVPRGGGNCGHPQGFARGGAFAATAQFNRPIRKVRDAPNFNLTVGAQIRHRARIKTTRAASGFAAAAAGGDDILDSISLPATSNHGGIPSAREPPFDFKEELEDRPELPRGRKPSLTLSCGAPPIEGNHNWPDESESTDADANSASSSADLVAADTRPRGGGWKKGRVPFQKRALPKIPYRGKVAPTVDNTVSTF